MFSQFLCSFSLCPAEAKEIEIIVAEWACEAWGGSVDRFN